MNRPAGFSRTFLVAIVTVLVALFAATAAQAATFHVDSTADAVDSNPGDGVCDDGTGHCTLRAAIDEANNLPSDDSIQLDAQRYTITQSGSNDDTNSKGDFDVFANGSLTIVGATSDPRDTVVSANGEDRVFQVLSGGRLTLRDLSVTDGSVTGETGQAGGGIFLGGETIDLRQAKQQSRQDSLATALDLSNTRVVNNVASDFGGGIADDVCSDITIDGSHIDRNSAGNAGGGIAACGELTMRGSTVDGNSTAQGDGGGIDFEGSEASLTDTSVSDNRAYDSSGGGIYGDGDSLKIQGGKVNDNVAYADGGGLYVEGGSLDLTDADVTDNSAQVSSGNFFLKPATVNGRLIQIGGANGGGIYYDGDEDFNVTDSTIHSNTATNGDGGGIYNGAGLLAVTRTDVTSNAAHFDGGGIWSMSDTTITDSTVDDNGDQSLICDSGGGIWGMFADLKVTGSSVSGNGSRGNGAGIYWSQGSVTVEDTNVDHNTTDGGEGGGIWAAGLPLEVTRSSVSHNHAFDRGGGIYTGLADTLAVTDSDVNDNNVDGNGGGIYDDGQQLRITGTSVSRNVATDSGGGLWHDQNGPGTIANTTISGNHAGNSSYGDNEGGGIFQNGEETIKGPSTGLSDDSLLLLNVTIAENEADQGAGGGIYTPGADVQLTNVLFANSTQGGAENNCGGDTGPSGSFTSNGNNLSTDDGTDCNLTETTDKLTASPKLGAIENNGGPSETQALKDGSDAIDNGDDTTCANAPVSGVDQRGFARPFGSHCDIGAYETGYADLAVISNVDSQDPVGAGSNVTYTITVKNIGPSPDTATGVVLHNVNPAGTTFVSASSSQGSCSGSGPVSCALGSLPIGATAQVQVTVKTGSAGLITDAASVSATTSDPNPSNDSASQDTTVVAGQVALAAAECKPSPPRSSISRNGLQARASTIKLVGRTIDFRCLGQTAVGGIKKVQVAIALLDGSKCQFLKANGDLTGDRSCSDRVFFTARLGHVRGGKVPWTFRKRHLSLPKGKYVSFALGTDSQNNKETDIRRYNRKKFRIR
jgi:uncharacterized repeat protein (TIGR01451 family)/CSLREA domain-containing protein